MIELMIELNGKDAFHVKKIRFKDHKDLVLKSLKDKRSTSFTKNSVMNYLSSRYSLVEISDDKNSSMVVTDKILEDKFGHRRRNRSKNGNNY